MPKHRAESCWGQSGQECAQRLANRLGLRVCDRIESDEPVAPAHLEQELFGLAQVRRRGEALIHFFRTGVSRPP